MQHYLRHIYYALPLQYRKWARRLYFLPKDLFKPTLSAIPPEGKNFTGSGDFINTGREFFKYFQDFNLINPDAQILEIGSGMGRMALPFKDYLSEKGHYTGIDIVEDGIVWCKTKITPGDTRFTYVHAPIYNTLYNPKSTIFTKDYKLPFPDGSLDFVFLTSVFTHLLPEDVSHYFTEIYRVLKAGGNFFSTYFIIDENNPNTPALHFNYKIDNHYIINRNIPEANVGYTEKFLLDLYINNNFFVEKILLGSWSGRNSYTSFQDIIIAKKHD
jgi:ubiquinone/menaquinone biosynthesis C-methylase UbiE